VTKPKHETKPEIEQPGDEELRAMGLEPRQAWIRSEPTGKAQRNRRAREKAEAQGRRQISIAVPDDARETVRTICHQLCAKELSSTELMVALQQSKTQQPVREKLQESAGPQISPRETRAIARQVLILATASGTAFVAGITLALSWG
jgi:hypothetical protein